VRFKEIYQHSGGYNEQHKNRRNATQQKSFVRLAGLMVLGEFVLKPFVASTLIDLPGDNSTR